MPRCTSSSPPQASGSHSTAAPPSCRRRAASRHWWQPSGSSQRFAQAHRRRRTSRTRAVARRGGDFDFRQFRHEIISEAGSPGRQTPLPRMALNMDPASMPCCLRRPTSFRRLRRPGPVRGPSPAGRRRCLLFMHARPDRTELAGPRWDCGTARQLRFCRPRCDPRWTACSSTCWSAAGTARRNARWPPGHDGAAGAEIAQRCSAA